MGREILGPGTDEVAGFSTDEDVGSKLRCGSRAGH